VKRIWSLWTQGTHSFLKIANHLDAARAQLSPDDFTTITSAMPFPRECVQHFLTISRDPRLTKKNRWSLFSATAVGLRAMAEMIEASPVEALGSISPDASNPTSPADASEAPIEPPTAAAPAAADKPVGQVAHHHPAPAGNVSISVPRLRTITGLSPREFRLLAALADEEFAMAEAVGFTKWLRNPEEAALPSARERAELLEAAE